MDVGVYGLIIVFLIENVLFAVYLFSSSKKEVSTETLYRPRYKSVYPQRDANPERTPSMSSHKYHRKLNSTWLENNPVYSKYYIEEAKVKKVVTILIIVSTAPKRLERRNSIRQTWWTQCVETGKVIPECIFMTDYQGPNDQYFHQVRAEAKQYKDMHFQLVTSGVTFGFRFISHMLYAVQKYEFDYFLRIDDDFYLCLDNLLHELPAPSLHNFHWGWVHKDVPMQIKRPEESIILLSRDIIETFLLQDPAKILCHPLADQMIATWCTVLNIQRLYRHDGRIHHHPPIHNTLTQVINRKNVCQHYMALHGAYDEDTKKLWKVRGTGPAPDGDLLKHSTLVEIHGPFNWRAFGGTWQYEPKLCIKDPTWDTSRLLPPGKSYGGRQGN